MKTITDIIQNNFQHLKSKIIPIAENEAAVLASSFSSSDEYSPERLKRKSADSQYRILETILDTEFLFGLFSDKNFSDEQLQLIKYEFRKLSPKLVVPYALPKTRLRPAALPIMALAGSVIGMLLTGFLFRLLLGVDYRQFGIIVGSAFGAFLFSYIGIVLSNNKIITRVLQTIFGVAVAAEIFTLFTSSLNPFSSLWRKLTGRFGGGLWGKIKRIFAFILAVLLLQITVPIEIVPTEQLKINAFDAIKSWLEHSIILLNFIVAQVHIEKKTSLNNQNEKFDLLLLKSLVKLATSEDPKITEFIAGEITMAFKNAGYEIKSIEKEKNPVFADSLKTEFDVEGYINNGDEYKILEMPLYKNNKLLIRGKLTKKR